MILASAQTVPHRRDINANLIDHYHLIELASINRADLIVFPEMSITGYERENADILAFSKNDPRLDKLKKLAVDNQIIIIAGAPIKISFNLFIGAFIFFPNNTISIYTKQFLHNGEEQYFKASFDYNPIIEFDNERISLAICADIDRPSHPENAYKSRSTIYISSLFFTPNGISHCHNILNYYAKNYSMNILMSNYSGAPWGLLSAGRSAFWTKHGVLVGELTNSGSGLLIVEENKEIWTRKIIYL